MLLTISCRGENARDLSWLLHKRPDRFQSFDLGYGNAFVYFTECSPANCVACLLTEIRAEGLNKLCKAKDGEFQYVNPRRYLSSSLLAAAITRVYGSALKGICADRPDLPDRLYDFTVTINNFSCRLDADFIEKIFAPLGYATEWTNLATEKYSEGRASFGNLTLSGHTTLQAILSQLYILLPVFDRQTHFWLEEIQVEKFIRHGEGWLEAHPEKRRIINEYFQPAADLRHRVGEHFNALNPKEDLPGLNKIRQNAIAQILSENSVKTVIDLGCGDGSLLSLLQKQNKYSRLAGMDAVSKNIENARKKLAVQGLDASRDIFVGSLMYRDKIIAGFDAAVLSEVLEHFEPERMEAVMENVLGNGRPQMLIVSTPNRTYNRQYASLEKGAMRHPDHRHEFDEAEFAGFMQKYAGKYGYDLSLRQIGEERAIGCPTLLGILKKCV